VAHHWVRFRPGVDDGEMIAIADGEAFHLDLYAISGSGTLTSVTVNFSYDGVSPTFLFTGSGHDNFGGPVTIQAVNELSPTTTACTISGAGGATARARHADEGCRDRSRWRHTAGDHPAGDGAGGPADG
jgi:hypothetical protein